MAVRRKAVGDDHRTRRIGEPPLDVVEAQDAVDRGNIERAGAKRDACRLAQSRRDHAHHGLAVAPLRQRDRVDLALPRRSDEQRAGGAPRHRARVGHAGDHADRESRRHADRVERQVRLRGRGARERQQRHAGERKMQRSS